MRFGPLLGVTLALAIGIGHDAGLSRKHAPVTEAIRARQQIESDLRLEAELKSAKTLQAGDYPRILLALRNMSKTKTYRVVEPGFLSDRGLREPHVYWTAIIDRGDGNWVSVPACAPYGYCGFGLESALAWRKDAILLKPGNDLKFGIPQQFEFQQVGRVRIRAHYKYRAQGAGRDEGFLPSEFAFMAGVPRFQIVSNPVEFDVIRPLDIRARVKTTLKANKKTRLSELLAVTLINQSMAPIKCSSPTLSADALLWLQTDSPLWPPDLTDQLTKQGVTRDVKPGEELSLLGPGRFSKWA